ncbi:MAG: hypothetical protein HY899_10530 [Deltaproteobacteria bacterium]|nr:hypothetical protein [Deltaproteobacteria bacterium]
MWTDARGPDSPRERSATGSYPAGGDPQSNQLAFMHASLWVLSVAAVASALLLAHAGQSPRLLLAVPFALSGVATWICIRMGRNELGYRIGVFGTWAATLAGLSVLNGVNGPTISAFAVILMMAGWLVGPRAALVLTISTPIAIAFLAFAAQSRWTLPISYPAPIYYAALVHAGVAVTAGLLGYFSSKTFSSQLLALRASRDALEGSVGELTARENELRGIQADLAQLNASLEQIVQERTAHLRAAMRDLETFSYSVSHDLRLPLRAISGYLEELVEAEGGLHEQGRRHAEAIERNILRMGQLIDGLLELARVNRAELRRSTIDMRALLSEILEQFVRQHSRTQLKVDEMPEAVGDPTLIRQVLANLVGNALKYSARKETPQVHVGWSESDHAWFVRDNGIGFDMSQASRLFTTFERLQDAKDFEGTGVGLAVVKSIVERHGGNVWAQGAPGDGATFYFTLQGAR